MAKKRRKIFRIETADQLRVLSSPAAMDIIQILRQNGPSTVNEIGPKIGRKSNSLHYHVRKLVDSGMVRKTGTRRSGARTQSIYDVVADKFSATNIQKDKSLQNPTNESVRALTRLAARDFARALERPESVRYKGRYRNRVALRVAARLSKSQIAEVNSYIQKIEEIYSDSVGSEKGEMCALMMVLAPLETQ